MENMTSKQQGSIQAARISPPNRRAKDKPQSRVGRVLGTDVAMPLNEVYSPTR